MLGNGIGIGVFGFILILGTLMDILGKEKCLHFLEKYWLHWGTIPSVISYVVVIACLIPFVVRLF